MKQIEITVRLTENIDEAIIKLKKLGYRLIRESDIDDIYLTNKISELNKDNIIEIISSCVLLRNLKIDKKEIKKITYKNKEYDNQENLISEKKINVECNELENAYKLFNCLGFEELIEVKYHVSVYEKDGKEYALQNVEGLGLLIEYENIHDFEDEDKNTIIKVKDEMYREILKTGINITTEKDVKKAKELILKKYFQ